MALGGSGHADTINSYPTSTACFADLRGHAVRLMKRRDWHGLHRSCDNQGEVARMVVLFQGHRGRLVSP